MFQLVGSGVHLGDDDVIVLLEVLSQLVVDRSQLFAVTAPVEGMVQLIFNKLILIQNGYIKHVAINVNTQLEVISLWNYEWYTPYTTNRFYLIDVANKEKVKSRLHPPPSGIKLPNVYLISYKIILDKTPKHVSNIKKRRENISIMV